MTLDRMFAYDWMVKEAHRKLNTQIECLKLEISNLERELEHTTNPHYQYQLKNRIKYKKMDLDRYESKMRRGEFW